MTKRDVRGSALQHLQELGFTKLEAEIYVFLLGEPGATGYRVAQAIGKPTANTYKAIASLTKKGAVLVDDDDARSWRPVPWRLLLDRLSSERQRLIDAASDALSRIGEGEIDDDGIYRLSSASMAIEAARRVIDEAKEAVLAVIGPSFVEPLREAFAGAAARGVDVAVKSYGAFSIAGVDCTMSTQPESKARFVIGEELNVVADGEALVAGTLNPPSEDASTCFALWSRNRVLALMQFNGLSVEIDFTKVVRGLAAKESHAALTKTALDVRYMSDTAGFRALAAVRV